MPFQDPEYQKMYDTATPYGKKVLESRNSDVLQYIPGDPELSSEVNIDKGPAVQQQARAKASAQGKGQEQPQDQTQDQYTKLVTAFNKAADLADSKDSSEKDKKYYLESAKMFAEEIRRLQGEQGQEQSPQQDISNWQVAKELTLESITGMGAMASGGFAAMAAGVFNGASAEEMSRIVDDTYNAWVDPVSEKTEEVKAIIEKYSPGAYIQMANKAAGEAVFNNTNSPMLATATETGLTVLEMVAGYKGGKVVQKHVQKKRVLKAEQRAIAKTEQIMKEQMQERFLTWAGTPKPEAEPNWSMLTKKITPKTEEYKFEPVFPTKQEFKKEFLAALAEEKVPVAKTVEEKKKLTLRMKEAYNSTTTQLQSQVDNILNLEYDAIRRGVGETPVPEKRSVIALDLGEVSKARKAAGAVTGTIAKYGTDAGKFIRDVYASGITLLDQIDPRLAHAARGMEQNIQNKNLIRHEMLSDVYLLSKKLEKSEWKSEWKAAYLNQDWKEMARIAVAAKIPLKGTVVDALADLKKVLDQVKGEAESVKFKNFQPIEGYLPRSMRPDMYEKLVQGDVLAGNTRYNLNKALNENANQDDVVRQNRLTRILLEGGQRFVAKPTPSGAKKRAMDTIPKEIMEAYEDPSAALRRYVDDMTEAVEIRRFLGEDTGDMKSSVQNYVDTVLKDKKLSIQEMNTIRTVLEARFTDGRKHAHPIIQSIKNLGYIETVANIISATTQIGDVINTMKQHGIRSTLAAIPQSLSKKGLRPSDVGYDNLIKEMASPSTSGKILDLTMEASQFSRIDRFGKRVVVNASMNDLKKKARSTRGRDELSRSYAPFVRGDLQKFLDDAEVGNIDNPDVKLAIFNDLMDLQPQTLFDMPLKYLQNPNGRILYALKTWQIHQINTLYRKTWLEAKRGNTGQATKNLIRFGVFSYGLAGVGVSTLQDWAIKTATGTDLTQEDINDEAVLGLYKLAGLNRYAVEKGHGDIWMTAASLVAPAGITAVGKGAKAIYEDKPEDLLELTPLLGRAIAEINKAEEQ